DLFAGVVATGAAALLASLPLPAGAAPPASSVPLPGAFRYKVGSFIVTALHDGFARMPLDGKFVVNAALDQVREALSDAFRPTDMLTIPYATPVVDTGAGLALLDAGTGGRLGRTTGTMI